MSGGVPDAMTGDDAHPHVSACLLRFRLRSITPSPESAPNGTHDTVPAAHTAVRAPTWPSWPTAPRPVPVERGGDLPDYQSFGLAPPLSARNDMSRATLVATV